jgi:hypothetical protein
VAKVDEAVSIHKVLDQQNRDIKVSSQELFLLHPDALSLLQSVNVAQIHKVVTKAAKQDLHPLPRQLVAPLLEEITHSVSTRVVAVAIPVRKVVLVMVEPAVQHP